MSIQKYRNATPHTAAILSAVTLAVATLALVGCVGAGSSNSAKALAPPSESPTASALHVTTSALPVGSVSSAYNASLLVTGGTPPYSWTKIGGQMPGGLSLGSGGVISGTPTTAGSFSFSATVIDSTVNKMSTNFSLNVSPAPVPSVSSVSPSSGSTEGGTSVTVAGANFGEGTSVQFGSTPAQSVRIVSASQLQAVTPEAAPGKVTVSIANSDGQVANVPSGFTYTSPANSPSPEPTAVTGDIVVDAGQTVSETGGDDLAAVKNIFASASDPESNGGLSDWNSISSEFSMSRMRIINGLGDCALSNGTLTGCTRLDGNLNWVRKENLSPHVIVGQWKPASISGDARQWGAAQWAQYDALAYAIVDHVVNKYQASSNDSETGFNQVLFEVGNEIDITQSQTDLWLVPSANVPQGDASRFKQYDTVYRHWAAQVDKVAKQNPSKNIQIAAQAEGYQWVSVSKAWSNSMISTYASQGVRFDAITLHAYGPDVNTIAAFAQSIRTALKAGGRGNVTVQVTEWGATASNDSHFGAMNATNQGASWGVQFLLQCLKGTVTGGSFLGIRDNAGGDVSGNSSNMYAATWMHVKNNTEYPKPIANAFSMVSKMTGTRRAATTNSAKPDLSALASSDSDSASVIVANYNTQFGQSANKDMTQNESVTVAFKNLPISGAVVIDRYVIDGDTSNLGMWTANGILPNSIQAAQLQKIESFSGTSNAGTLSLPARTLGQSAVSLWIIHR